ncbi:MAG: hypothetical protein JXQ27_08375 [Acidobacteria bacterium]|nr:hypothetical protein [Acidobacteriota bacterium]
MVCLLMSGGALAQVPAPTATTNAATGIGATQATFNGTVNANGASTTVWFEYGLDTSYGFTFPADPSPVTGSTDTAVSATVPELLPGATYHFRVVAQNAGGTTYGADMTFTTLRPPLAQTEPATGIGVDAATLNGLVTPFGLTTTVTFQYGTDTTYGTTVTAIQSPLPAGINAPFPVSVTLSGLANNTTYHYRVVAQNTDGTAYGEDLTFLTGGGTAPTAVTNAASGITATSAVLNGTVTANGAETVVTFEYGLDTGYGSVIAAVPYLLTGTSATAVSATPIELLANTTYHYRVVAVNANGTTYGADMTFTTMPLPPTASTGFASPIGTTTATLNGVVTANDSSTTVTFQYGLTTAYGTTVTADQSPVTGSADTAVSRAITGLSNNTTYHFRVVAINTGGTTYGADQTFITGTAAPTAVTQAATMVTPTSATLNGTVNANNTDATAWFELGETTAYGRTLPAVPGTVTGSVNTAVSALPADLIPGITYHFRVVAQNSSGISYGADMAFQTFSPPAVMTGQADPVTTSTATLTGLVTAFNSSTMVTFEYGTTTAYGTTVTAAQSPVTGNTPVPVSVATGGLTADTTYHFRVVAANSFGTTYGQDMTFLTTVGAPSAVTLLAAASFNSAILHGTVNAHNISTTVTFEYGTTIAYGNTVTAVPSPVAGSVDIPVSAAITGLNFNTTYHFRVVAVNAGGTTYGDDLTFLTTLNPSAITLPATDVGGSYATLNGLANPNNGAWSVAFDYGTTIAYGSTAAAVPSTVTGTEETPVSAAISNLLPETTYHYRVRIFSGALNYYGADMTFTTGTLPSVLTLTASGIGGSSATLNGTVNPKNMSTTVFFEFGETIAYGRVVTADQSPVAGNSDTPVSATMTNLVPNMTYHYRVVAQNANGTAYGLDETFTTPAEPPAATTLPASGVTDTTAGLNGTVEPKNASTTVWFEYGLTAAYGSIQAAAQSPLTGSGTQPVSATAAGLTTGVMYHYRVAAQNSGGTVYGEDRTFVTGVDPPTATTLAATDTNPGGATLHGLVNAGGGTASIYFELGLDTTYGRIIAAIPGAASGTANTAVSAVVNDLLFNNWYHYRVMSVNEAGTAYGQDMMFRSVTPPLISGTVTDGTHPLENVIITFSHDGHTETTDAAGYYSYRVPYETTTTVTPSHPGYHGWVPPDRTLTTLTADAPNQDFSGTINTYTISGTVTDSTNPLENVTITFSHDGHTETTAADGQYSYVVDYGTTTTLTPSHPGYHGWIPADRTVTAIAADTPGQDFSGTINTYTISGTVTDGIDPLAGVTITFSHDGHIETTDAAGQYSYEVDYGTTTTLTPSHPDYHNWRPERRSLTDIAADEPDQDFAGKLITFSISGRIMDAGHPVEGAIVTFSHDGATVTTDADGHYTRSVPIGTTTTITPSHPQIDRWDPVERVIEEIAADTPGQDFHREYRLYGAHIASSDVWQTRMRVVNPVAAISPVTVHLFDAAGQLLLTTGLGDLPGNGCLETDFGDLPATAKSDSEDLWMYVSGHTPLTGTLFFGTRDQQTAVAMPLFRDGNRDFLFPFVYQGDDWYTAISLLNPTNEAVQVMLTAVAETGDPLGILMVDLPPLSKYARLLGDLFSGVDPLAVRAVYGSSPTAVFAFELFSSGVAMGPGLVGLPPVALDAGCSATTTAAFPTVVTAAAEPVPAPVRFRGWGISDTEIFLRWDMAPTAAGIDHYQVYTRDGIFPQLVGTTADTCFIVPGLDPQTVHALFVTAINEQGQASPPAADIFVPTLAPGEYDGTSRIFYNEVPDPALFSTGLTMTNLGTEAAMVYLKLFSDTGQELGAWEWLVNPAEQITREVDSLFEEGLPAGSLYFKASADSPLTGFSLFYTRPDSGEPFMFDGAAGVDLGDRRLCLAAEAGGPGWSSLVRLTNLTGLDNAVTLTAYGADGALVGAVGYVLDPQGRLDLGLEEMFLLPEGEIHWIQVTGGGELAGTLFSLSPDLARLIVIQGQPLE